MSMSVSNRFTRFSLWALLSLFVLSVMPVINVSAQDKKKKGAEAEAAAEETTEETTDTAKEPAKAGEGEGGGHGESQNTLYWIAYTSGYIGAVLLVISIYFVTVVTQLFMELRAPLMLPPTLIDECNALLSKRDLNGVYKLTKENPSELGQLIAAGLVAFPGGLADSREAIDRAGEVITVDLEKRISMLAVIGSLGPMIGLLGTLKGMIASFGTIATSGTQLKASEVAGGISEALLITFEGVALSVPAIYFFAVFKNRVSTLTVRAINAADDFIRRVHTAAHSKSAPSTAGTAAPPAAPTAQVAPAAPAAPA